MMDVSEYIKAFGNVCGNLLGLQPKESNDQFERVNEIFQRPNEMYSSVGMSFIRIAGISGVCAVSLGAYGAHVFREKEKSDELKVAFETANRYHMFHTLALLSTPLMNRPLLVGSLMTCGMVIFSGSCYYHALTGDKRFRKVTPYGGILLILAWASMVL